MKPRVTYLVLLILFSITIRTSHAASDGFIQDLLDSGDQFRALTILKEKEFRFRGTENGFDASRKILGLYIEANEFDHTESWLDRMHKHYKPMQKQYSRPLLKGELAYLYRNYPHSLSFLRKVDPDKREPAFSFSSVLDNPMRDNALNPKKCKGTPCTKLNAFLKDYKDEGDKSPTLALFLGLIPGMGQIYGGLFWGGIASFLVNGLIVTATTFAAINDEKVLASVTGVLGVGFYFSSIYAGYETTRRYNDVRLNNFRDKVHEIPIQLTLFKLAL